MSSEEIKGQILWSGTMTFPIDQEKYMMQSVCCPNCDRYLGAYNTYYYPDGIQFVCTYCKEKLP